MIFIRNSLKLVFFCCILLFLIHSVAAFTVASTSVTPPGYLYDDLQFVTDLEDPRWTYSIAVNGVKNTRPVTGDRTITINGFELGYRNQDEVIVYVLLQGNIPKGSVMGTNRTMVRIQELDARGYSIAYSAVNIDRLIGTPTPTPTPAYGSVTVTSTPAGANIYIDNVYKGLSPATFSEVPNGDHLLLIRLDWYQDLTKKVTITGDNQIVQAQLSQQSDYPITTSSRNQTPGVGTGSRTPTVPSQTPGYGSLSITTAPAGALVYVDGTMRGVTPTTIPMLAEGPHSVTLVMDGYQDLKTTIIINAGTTSEYITGLPRTTKSPGFSTGIAVLSISILFLYGRKRE